MLSRGCGGWSTESPAEQWARLLDAVKRGLAIGGVSALELQRLKDDIMEDML